MFFRLFSPRTDVRRYAVPPGRRVYAIGDIHGRLDLLDGLIGLIEADHHGREPMAADIVLLGDMIDRGPDSAGVVRRAMTPPAWARCFALMGNHEAAMIKALGGGGDAMNMWLNFGGRESLISWGISADLVDCGTNAEIEQAALSAIPRRELAWLAQLPQHLRIGDYFLVHAGVRPGVALDQQMPQDSYWIREEFLRSNRDHGAMIVHGHTISPEAEQHGNRIGIDTGAYTTGRLTALALEGEDRWFLQT